ncbi:MAG: hypothetical protein ACYC6M_15350 [Terriglobales bacterium]
MGLIQKPSAAPVATQAAPMASPSSSIYVPNGFDDAKVMAEAIYLDAGKHRVTLERCKLVQHKLKGTAIFVAELRVVESTAHPAGALISYTENLNDPLGYGASGVKRLLAVCMGGQPDEVKGSDVAAVCAEDQPLAGTALVCHAIKQHEDKPFTRKQWTLEALSPALAQAAQAQAG